MPAGIPVATVAIGDAGAKNAALLAIQILGMTDTTLQQKIVDYRNELKQAVSENYNFDLD
jgi:5-(carboxyamino)imidazole ribonucleotide mutase